MAFNPIAHAIGQSTNLTGPAVTGTMNATGATLIVAWVNQVFLGPAIAAVSDSTSSNTWTKLNTVPGTLIGALYYTLNPTVSATMTVIATPVSGSAGTAVSASAFSGARVAGVFDQQNGTSSDLAGTIQPGSITPGFDKELVVTGFGGVSEAATINSGFTITDSVAVAAGAAYSNGMAYKIQTSAAAVNPTWSVVTPQPCVTAIASFRAEPADATGFTATARQSSVNQNQKGYAIIAPSPSGEGFGVATTIIANCTNGTSNFIRQSDGVQATGSVTLTGTETAVMEVFSTQSAASIVFSWTTNNAAITSPAATSFTVQVVESAFVSATPSMLWNYSVANSGFLTTPADASTVAHGTGCSQIVIASAGTRAWGEYITDTRRTICLPSTHIDPSNVMKDEIYLENSTPVPAYNIKIYEDETNTFGTGFEFPDTTGAYVYYRRTTPFNGKERLNVSLFFYDHDGTLPKITSTISNLTTFFSAFSTDAVGKASVNYIPENTTITLAFTASTDILTIPGSWTAVMPFVIKGLSRTTSRIEGTDPNWYNIIDTPLHVQSVQFENLTYDPTNIGQFSASNSGSIIFKDCDIIETLGEFSKNFGVTTGSQWSCPNGVFFINCKVRAVSCEGMAGIRSSGDGLRNLIPDVVVGFDFFQNSYAGYIFSTYAKRFSNPGVEPGIPLNVVTTVTVASSAFNVGTNSNLTRIVVSDMPQTNGCEWLKYTESITVAGTVYPVVIGRTDVPNGIIYVGGDITSVLTDGVTTLQLSAIMNQRNHYVNTLSTLGSGTNNHDGSASLAWSNSMQPENVNGCTQLRFATTTTTTALRGLSFPILAINGTSRTVTVSGELAGSAVDGDLIWLSQIAHADSNQVGLDNSTGQDTGPLMEQNYLNEGFQTLLLQSGATFKVGAMGLVNVVSAGFQGQIQDATDTLVYQNTMWTGNILQNAVASAANFSINASIVISTSANSPPTWNDGVLFTNSHGIDEALPNGIGNTTGAITYNAFYNSTTSSVQLRSWNTNVAFDMYGNAATTNGSTYSRIGAVLGDPTSDAPIIPGTLVLLSQTLTQAVFQFGSANGLAVTMTFQSSTSNGVAWADLISLPNQDFSGVQYATDAPPLGQTWIFREEFTNVTDTEYSNTLTLNGLAPLFAGTISHVTSGLLLGMV